MPEKISSTTRLFANDSPVYRIIRSNEDQALLQEDLDKIQKWGRGWLMQFNPDKCEAIWITNIMNPFIQTSMAHNYKQSRVPSTTTTNQLNSPRIYKTTRTSKNRWCFSNETIHQMRMQPNSCYLVSTSVFRPVFEFSCLNWLTSRRPFLSANFTSHYVGVNLELELTTPYSQSGLFYPHKLGESICHLKDCLI